jgi:hypothetical protein
MATEAKVGDRPTPRKIRDQSLGEPLGGAERFEGPAASEDASVLSTERGDR